VPSLDAELAATVPAFAERAAWLLFEYDSPSFADSLVPMSADGAFGSPHWVLEGDAVVVPGGLFHDEQYEPIEPWDRASDLFESWLIARWNAFPSKPACPAFVGHHDSYFVRDLRTGEQTNTDEIKGDSAKCERQVRFAQSAGYPQWALLLGQGAPHSMTGAAASSRTDRAARKGSLRMRVPAHRSVCGSSVRAAGSGAERELAPDGPLRGPQAKYILGSAEGPNS